MPRFFIESVDSEHVVIEGDDARHISLSLRMKRGDTVTLCSGGVDYICELDELSPEKVVCRVLEKKLCENEPNIYLHLFQALPKGSKAETIVQKSVELGISGVTFVLTSNCVARPDEKGFSKKLERLNRISLEAAKQSGRGRVPQIDGLATLEQAVERMKAFDKAVWCYEKGGVPFGSLGLAPNTKIGLLIGSEGGFSDKEAKTLPFEPVSLGKRILRCETAPLAAAAIIMNLTGNM